MTRDNQIASVTKAFRVLQLLEEEDGLGVSELATELGTSKSTAHRYLKTLLAAEYVVNDDGVYRVGLRCLSHGIRARSRYEGYQLVRDKVEDLAQETGERVNFVVAEHGNAVCLSQALGERGVRLELSVGDRVPLHVISPGKAILATWDDERVDHYIAECGLTGTTENTIADAAALWEDIERIRERGFSQSRQEYVGELNGVAAVIDGADGGVLGAIGISGPTHRMQDERFNEQLPELLMGTVREITLNLQYR
jgi:DNA-binding IclR family transcriptional regulator